MRGWWLLACVSGNPSKELLSTASQGRSVAGLLAAKAEIDTVDEGNASALHLASQGGHVEVVRELLAAGAQVSWKGPSDLQALRLDVIPPKQGLIPRALFLGHIRGTWPHLKGMSKWPWSCYREARQRSWTPCSRAPSTWRHVEDMRMCSSCCRWPASTWPGQTWKA